MGRHDRLVEGTSGLAGGRGEAVSCSLALPPSLVSQHVAIARSAAVLQPLTLSAGVLHLESRKSRRRSTAVALGGVGAWRRVNPGQEENRQLRTAQNCRCLINSHALLVVRCFCKLL